VANGTKVLASVVSSQDTIHAAYGGIVPELACRSHIENIRPVIDTALHKAGVTLHDIDMIATTQGPGLIGALLVGFSLAKALSYSLRTLAVHHLEGHINLSTNPQILHLLLWSCLRPYDLYYAAWNTIFFGRTRDDAVVVSDTAKMLHLGYPGANHRQVSAEETATTIFRGYYLENTLIYLVAEDGSDPPLQITICREQIFLMIHFGLYSTLRGGNHNGITPR
jgi:tRNA A37 threonylcarbamoyltransferase TsaD